MKTKISNILIGMLLLVFLFVDKKHTAQTRYTLDYKPEPSVLKLPVLNQPPEEEVDLTGLYLGGNIGFYFANKSTAGYYNGSSINNVDSVLKDGGTPLYVSRNYQAIREALGDYDFEFDPADLPQDMKYNTAINIGFLAKYHLNNNFGLLVVFNYTKLKSVGGFPITVLGRLDPGTIGDSYEQCAIYGFEERINFDVGIFRSFRLEPNFNWYVEGGLNINDTELLENKIQVAGLEFSLANPYYTMYNLKQGGIGMGLFLGTGLQLVLGNHISFDPGISCYFTRINLGNESPYKTQFAPYIRITASNIF